MARGGRQPTQPNEPTMNITLYRAHRHQELTYQGECAKPSTWGANLQPHGWGTRYYRNGSHYQGQWLNGLREGFGEWRGKRRNQLDSRHPDEIPLYSGQWQRGKRHGYGIQLYSSRSYYEGLWHLGQRHGWGRMTYEDGQEYEGGWRQGQRDGAGLLACPNGDQFEGVWRRDQRNGPGKYLSAQTQRLMDGVWVDNVFIHGIMESTGPSSAAKSET